MLKFQGQTIPRFIDSFKVQLPGSEQELHAIAVSYIPGELIVERAAQLHHQRNTPYEQKWYPMAREIFKAVYEFHQIGVRDLDIQARNVLVVKNSTLLKHLTNNFSTRKEREPYPKLAMQVDDVSAISFLGEVLEPWKRRPNLNVRDFIQRIARNYPDEPWVAE
ncbi:hypothetical protein CPB84DRAFT_290550 [Gymnopilus junonius]|uniref:Protein kinase domain-containing protein n=1 Tax=Gymnopilus junonius TaxID=109634 RepID=A0A9P5NDE1_GYMJU|nr:hypothetical protein CPB84DRAFT_290550 [Gymnopilus junonius]